MRNVNLRALYLADFSEHLPKPGGFDIEGLATLDAGEFYGAEAEVLILVVTNYATLAAECAF